MMPDRALFPHSTDDFFVPGIDGMWSKVLCEGVGRSTSVTDLIGAQRAVLDAIATGSSLQSTHTQINRMLSRIHPGAAAVTVLPSDVYVDELEIASTAINWRWVADVAPGWVDMGSISDQCELALGTLSRLDSESRIYLAPFQSTSAQRLGALVVIVPEKAQDSQLVEWIELASYLMGIAAERWRLADRLDRRHVLEQLARRIVVVADEAADLPTAMQAALDVICVELGWPVGHATLYDPSGEFVPSSVWHLPPEDTADPSCARTRLVRAAI